MATGSCLCGGVAFTVSGEFSDMTHCHCSMCRKIHGSQFATYFCAQQLTYTKGQELIRTYESSPGFDRSFCGCCGSVLPEQSPVDGNGVYVAAGLLDDDPGIRPTAHIFSESKADGYAITDALPQQLHYGDNDLSRVVEIAEPAAVEGAVTGGCQCGEVKFQYSGEPKMTMNCHCSRCRKVKGAAHATNTFVPVDQLEWLQGEHNIVNYDHEPAERFGNAFCKSCGSSLPRAKGPMYNVPVGSLDQAPGIDPKGHIFMGSKAPWFEVTDDLSQWDEMPT